MGAVAAPRMLVEGKLRVPPAPGRLLARPRVEGLIAAMIDRYPVVFLIATAGAGKTTALVQAARLVDRPLAWLTVGNGDVAPGRLLEYLGAAISAHVPAAKDMARSALAAGLSQDEVAGLLAESVGDERLLLVVDEAERIVESPKSLAVIDAMLRYVSPGLHVAVASRRELPLDIAALQLSGSAGLVDEQDLALNEPEAADALGLLGSDADPHRAVEATGGWVAGVMFEAWQASGSEAGEGGRADPLHGYLARNIVDQLTVDERELLLVTSVLPEVTGQRADELGIVQADARLAALRARHLPATWRAQPLTMRCHPRFREYLLERFAQESGAQVPAARRAFARIMQREGHPEEAVEAFIAAGALEEGAAVAEGCIFSIVERLDFEVAERWLDAFAGVRSPDSLGFVTAELMICVWTGDQSRGAAVGDRLKELDQRDRLLQRSSLVAALLAVCYGTTGIAPRQARLALDLAPPSPLIDAVRYTMTLADDELANADAVPPTLTGGPLDVGVLRAHYHRGELALLAEEPPIAWDTTVEPWRILALQALGQTGRALERFERCKSTTTGAWMAGIELMIDLGRYDDATRLLERAPERPQHGKFDPFVGRAQILKAKIALRRDQDADAARRALAPTLRSRTSSALPFLRDHARTWLGLAALLEGSNEEAVELLRTTVAQMTRSGLRLLLPAAAVYLAEAEWRNGDEEAADRAADVAIQAAEFQGSNHILLQALCDFPAVAWRRADAEPRADSAWHRLARALRRPADVSSAPIGAGGGVQIVEFGEPRLLVGGCPVVPKLSKALSLLALLASEPDHEVRRRRALRDLFDSGSDASTVAYLRLAVRAARETLPPELELAIDRERVRCRPPGSLRSESARFESLLSAADRMAGTDRLDALTEALELHRRGVYLDGDASPWSTDRRRQLDELAEVALLDAAATAYELGEYREAERLSRDSLARNPYRESGWRMLMRIAGATHDGDGVIDAYRGAESALAELGGKPSAATLALLDELRR